MKKATSKEIGNDPVKDQWNTFSREEILSFNLTGHRKLLNDRYMSKIASRPPNPRLDEWGQEVLNPHSLVADIDLLPLSMKQNLGRFVRSDTNPHENEEFDPDNDESFNADDRIDNPPTPHELRAKRLEKKISKARAAQREAEERAKLKAATPPSEDKKSPPVQPSEAKSDK